MRRLHLRICDLPICICKCLKIRTLKGLKSGISAGFVGVMLFSINDGTEVIASTLPTITTQRVASEHILKGVVRDENWDPLPGVNVMVKNTQKRVATDRQDTCQLNLAVVYLILAFSFIRYTTSEVALYLKQTLLKVVFEPETQP